MKLNQSLGVSFSDIGQKWGGVEYVVPKGLDQLERLDVLDLTKYFD